MQKERDNLGNLKNVVHFEEGMDSATPEGRVREMKNSHGRIKKQKKEIEKRGPNGRL